MSAVVDTSAVLALLFEENGRARVADVIDSAKMSAVNFAELVSKLTEKAYPDDVIEAMTEGLLPAVVPFDSAQAAAAGRLRKQTREKGLSLGDRACLALALREGVPALTADRKWAELDIGVEIEVIR